jgi:hypothetical protein
MPKCIFFFLYLTFEPKSPSWRLLGRPLFGLGHPSDSVKFRQHFLISMYIRYEANTFNVL